MAQALDKGRDRWDDAPYLLQIVFTALIAGDEGTTGYGISHIICDNEHPILHVDVDEKKIYLSGTNSTEKPGSKGRSFEEFIKEFL